MPEIAFWRDQAERFQQLQQEHGNRLGACWSSSPWNQSGDLWYLDGGASEIIPRRFQNYAERAAVELGHHRESSALFFWLDLLKNESSFYSGGGVSAG
jgi:hypothetical protein